MLVIIDLPMISPRVQQSQAPHRFLYRAVLLLCAIGSYTVANSPVAVLPAALFRVLGYALKRLAPAPLILGFALGPQLEDTCEGHARMKWRSEVFRTAGQPRLGGRDGCATRTDGAAGRSVPAAPFRRLAEDAIGGS